MPAPESARTLLESVRRLDAAGVDLVDIGLRRPSLDEVFLSLTGHQASGVADGDGRGADGERGREDREGVPA